MSVRTKNVYDPPAKDDGYRVLVMRFWPRGVGRSKVDAWEKDLGTLPEDIRAWKQGKIEWSEFARRYRKAIKPEAAKIAALADRARRETVTLLCGCRDEDHCHRTILKDLVLAAAVRRTSRTTKKKPARKRKAGG